MSKRQSSKKKYVFSLKVQNLSELHSKYNIEFITNKTNIEETISSELHYHDELRKIHKCCMSAVQYSKSNEYCCFWCRHPFSSTPIGCPIEYSPRVISRVYNSEITKDTFVVNESIASNQEIKDQHILKTKESEHYESDGIFCSLNCTLAFAIENKHNPTYSKSVMLVHKIYNEIVENKTSSLIPSPSWRMLKEYGGNLSIEEFRKNFQRISYENRGIHRLAFRPIAFVFEEKFKL